MIATRFFDDFAEDPLVPDEDLSLRIRRPRRIKMTIPKLRTKIDEKNPLGGNKAQYLVERRLQKATTLKDLLQLYGL